MTKMYVVIYTVRTYDNAGRPSYLEDWDLHDTLEEARARCQHLVGQWDDALQSYHIAEILESTQPELLTDTQITKAFIQQYSANVEHYSKNLKREIWGTER
jgi:hypothetical protein